VLIEQYDAFKLTPNWQSMLGDCVHPNTTGYAFKAQRTVATLIQKVMK
jgi:hypothetical protein